MANSEQPSSCPPPTHSSNVLKTRHLKGFNDALPAFIPHHPPQHVSKMENQKICIAVKHPQRKRESAGLTEVRQSEHGLTELPLSLLRSLSNLRTIDFSHNV
jgi:hypothetical protein